MVCVGVPRRDEKPLRELGRNTGDKAGGLSVGSVTIASGKCLLLPGDHIIPNNLTMPFGRAVEMWPSPLLKHYRCMIGNTKARVFAVRGVRASFRLQRALPMRGSAQ